MKTGEAQKKERYSATMHMEKTGVTEVVVLSSGNSRKIDLDLDLV